MLTIADKCPSIISTCKYYLLNFTEDKFFSHLYVYAKINNFVTKPLKLLYFEVHNSPQKSAHFIEMHFPFSLL